MASISGSALSGCNIQDTYSVPAGEANACQDATECITTIMDMTPPEPDASAMDMPEEMSSLDMEIAPTLDMRVSRDLAEPDLQDMPEELDMRSDDGVSDMVEDMGPPIEVSSTLAMASAPSMAIKAVTHTSASDLLMAGHHVTSDGEQHAMLCTRAITSCHFIDSVQKSTFTALATDTGRVMAVGPINNKLSVRSNGGWMSYRADTQTVHAGRFLDESNEYFDLTHVFAYDDTSWVIAGTRGEQDQLGFFVSLVDDEGETSEGKWIEPLLRMGSQELIYEMLHVDVRADKVIVTAAARAAQSDEVTYILSTLSPDLKNITQPTETITVQVPDSYQHQSVEVINDQLVILMSSLADVQSSLLTLPLPGTMSTPTRIHITDFYATSVTTDVRSGKRLALGVSSQDSRFYTVLDLSPGVLQRGITHLHPIGDINARYAIFPVTNDLDNSLSLLAQDQATSCTLMPLDAQFQSYVCAPDPYTDTLGGSLSTTNPSIVSGQVTTVSDVLTLSNSSLNTSSTMLEEISSCQMSP